MGMKIKRFASLALAALLLSFLMACGSSGSVDYGGGDGDFQYDSAETNVSSESAAATQGTESKADTAAVSSGVDLTEALEGKKVGIFLPTKDQARWLKDGAALVSKFKARGADVEIDFADNDAASQSAQITSYISKGCDLLVISPVAADALGDAMTAAKNAGIPVISYDRLILNTDAVSVYVSFDNYKIGKMQSDYIADQLKISDLSSENAVNIEFFAGDSGDHNAEYGFMGAYDALREYIDEGKAAVPSGSQSFEKCATAEWSENNAESRMKELITSHYSDGTQLDAVVCANDSVALGVIKALASDYKGENEVLVTGMDCDDANLRQLVDGKQSMDVYKAFGNEASVAVTAAGALLQGVSLDENLTNNGEWNFECAFDTESYNNGAEDMKSYLLTPVLVTKDNIKKELVDTGYYTMEGDYPVSIN